MIPFVYRRLNLDWVMDWTWTKLCLRKEFDRASTRSVLVTVAESRTTSQRLNTPESPTQPTRRHCVVERRILAPATRRRHPAVPRLVADYLTTRLSSTYRQQPRLNILNVYPSSRPLDVTLFVTLTCTFWWQFCEYILPLLVAVYRVIFFLYSLNHGLDCTFL